MSFHSHCEVVNFKHWHNQVDYPDRWFQCTASHSTECASVSEIWRMNTFLTLSNGMQHAQMSIKYISQCELFSHEKHWWPPFHHLKNKTTSLIQQEPCGGIRLHTSTHKRVRVSLWIPKTLILILVSQEIPVSADDVLPALFVLSCLAPHALFDKCQEMALNLS